MFDVSPFADGSICTLVIYENPYPFNIFGIPLFNGYYTTHDPVKSQISFVPTPDSPKPPLRRGDIPTQLLDAPLSETDEIIIWVVSMALLAVLGWVVGQYWVPFLQ